MKRKTSLEPSFDTVSFRDSLRMRTTSKKTKLSLTRFSKNQVYIKTNNYIYHGLASENLQSWVSKSRHQIRYYFRFQDVSRIPCRHVKICRSVSYRISSLVLLLKTPDGNFCNWLLCKLLHRNIHVFNTSKT